MYDTGVRARPLVIALILLLSAGTLHADTIPHPDDPSKQVEYFTGKPAGNGPWPAIVLVHGHQADPRPGAQGSDERLAAFAERGVLAVAVSQSGYGNSSGPPDFCGPFTQHAVAAVIAKLRADGVVASGKLVLLGVSRGATVVAMVAARDPDIAGLILIAGEYDIAALAADSTVTGIRAAIRQNVINESGGSVAALDARTVLNHAQAIKAPTLIMHGEDDDRTSPANARRLGEAMKKNGNDVRLVMVPKTGHSIPQEARRPEIDPFLARIWGKAVAR